MKKKSNLRPLAVFIVTTGFAAAAAPSGRAQDQLPSKEQQAQMAPMQGYLKAHKDPQKPFELLGGPIKVTVKQTSGGVLLLKRGVLIPLDPAHLEWHAHLDRRAAELPRQFWYPEDGSLRLVTRTWS